MRNPAAKNMAGAEPIRAGINKHAPMNNKKIWD